MEGFLHYQFEGLIFGGAYTWRGLFLEFYGRLSVENLLLLQLKQSNLHFRTKFTATIKL